MTYRQRYGAGDSELERGDLLTVVSGAGYGVAYPARGTTEWGSVTLPSGTACLHLGPDEVETDLRMQPMVRIMVDGRILSMDRRFLRRADGQQG